MSAFLCNDKHLSILADAVNDHIYKSCYNNGKIIFKQLKQLNIESVNYRYGENNSTDVDESGYSNRYYGAYNLFELIKASNCYVYQSCELPNYKEKEAFKLVDRLIHKLTDLIIKNDDRYNLAEWEIN